MVLYLKLTYDYMWFLFINHLLAAPELTLEHSAIFSVKHKKCTYFE